MNADHRLVQRLLWSVGEARRHRSSEPVAGEPVLPERPPEAQAPRSTIPAAMAAALGFASSPTTGTRLDLSVGVRGGQAVLGVGGELDGETAPIFLERVQALADGGARSVIVDLGGAAVDARGLDALVGASALLARSKGEIVLKSPRSDTLKILDLAGLGSSFVIC